MHVNLLASRSDPVVLEVRVVAPNVDELEFTIVADCEDETLLTFNCKHACQSQVVQFDLLLQRVAFT